MTSTLTEDELRRAQIEADNEAEARALGYPNLISMQHEMAAAEQFGGCPHCGQTDGCTNVGRSHWFFCKAHKTKWCIGANLFSSWRHETEDEQRRQYDEIGLGEFTEVKPLACTDEEIEAYPEDIPFCEDSPF